MEVEKAVGAGSRSWVPDGVEVESSWDLGRVGGGGGDLGDWGVDGVEGGRGGWEMGLMERLRWWGR